MIRYATLHDALNDLSWRAGCLTPTAPSHRHACERGAIALPSRERPRPYFPVARLERDDQFSGHPSSVLHLDAMRLGPLADLGAVQAVRPMQGAARHRTAT
jgi:hypothetical protein